MSLQSSSTRPAATDPFTFAHRGRLASPGPSSVGQREIPIEHIVEGSSIGVIFHQRRGHAFAEYGTLDSEGRNASGRIERLTQTGCQPRLAKRIDKREKPFLHDA